jgi:membrane-associated phospholipid phosphatase
MGIFLVLLLAAPAASADTVHAPWYKGPPGRNRIVHLSITVGTGAAWLLLATAGSGLNPTTCRWCDPPGFDSSVRNALVWHNVGLADTLSTIDAYAVAPALATTLLYFSDGDASWSRLIDDVVPVAETVAVSGLLTQVIKVSVGRQRPYAHFGAPATEPTSQDNLSFLSGHSVLGFSITASAGLICHWRGYWTEPYVWGAGIALSLSTEYLRIAADKHYLTDVAAGGALGIAAGLTIPRLMRRSIVIVPVSNGAAIVGQF